MTQAAETTEGTEKMGEAEDMKNVVDFITQKQYPRLLAEATPNEECLPCLLCEPVCPTEAIRLLDRSRVPVAAGVW